MPNLGGWDCSCGFDGAGHQQFSAAWYRAHRDHHVAAFPDLDARSRKNLDLLAEWNEERERRQLRSRA